MSFGTVLPVSGASAPSVVPRTAIFVLLCVLQCAVVRADQDSPGEGYSEQEHEIPPAHAVLFPFFTLSIAVLVFFLLSRYAKILPYTAVMFLIGTLMGIGASLSENENHLSESIALWTDINSEVLLLVFLPGIIFKDAMSQSPHLFRVALSQLFIFAFPMVLADTVLVALVAYYIFPFDWSFNLCMTFGSILSATDPVAVAALMEQVGAPPRLKVHVAGESLLNDGSAIVFFAIFSARYLNELGVPGIGDPVDLRKGIGMFCQKALGGVFIGLCFAIALLIVLFKLKRRFNSEENVVEVSTTIAVAYVGYYTAEAVFNTSGVISTVTTGLLVNYFGSGLFNDADLFDDFSGIVEHLLNTVLFTLGGTVWGVVIADGEKEGSFRAEEWGYLILLYVLLHVIRAFLFGITYPITNSIGLKTCWQETVFQIYGGLRGAVGIALAIAIDNEVATALRRIPGGEDAGARFEEQTTILFGFVGGIAFLTLCINATTAAPLLKRLGLTDSSETRERIVKAYHVNFRSHMLDRFVELLTYPRFKHVNFAVIKHHVPMLADLSRQQLLEAVQRHSDRSLPGEYEAPHLLNVLPYLDNGDDDEENLVSKLGSRKPDDLWHYAITRAKQVEKELRSKNRKRRKNSSTLHFMMSDEPLSTKEMRVLFISILRAAYAHLIKEGELEDRKLLSVALKQSLDFAGDEVDRGSPIDDWKHVCMIDEPYTHFVTRLHEERTIGAYSRQTSNTDNTGTSEKRLKIERSLAFMAAHRFAQKYFVREFGHSGAEFSEACKVVLEESKKQTEKAQKELEECEEHEVQVVTSHKFCMILLNSGIFYVGKLTEIGMLKDAEAEEWVESLEEKLRHVLSCDALQHPGEKHIEGEDESEMRSRMVDDEIEEHDAGQTSGSSSNVEQEEVEA